MSGFAVAILLLFASLNALVSVAVCRSVLFDRMQKALQVLLIWLLPVIGAVLVGAFLVSQSSTAPFDHAAVEANDDIPPLGCGVDDGHDAHHHP
ncbi:hypothetical protein [Jeongeupia naejangsanensis]|uniref:Cardiolipin synthase N-terminal domain-containing protein n=1 Tax=Jeongeupia naejangsanensis TaxID=613195 RepID=A0ABS2BLX8_9NEIS|nr:hypothetical protein [Jeongeupia naejangsanensis]MBM3116622.1 hypothetical protein [Jeongeupia naejangsanensis]